MKLFNVNNKDTKRRQWCRFGVFIVNFEHISHLPSSVSIVNFEHVIANWAGIIETIIIIIIKMYMKICM